MSGKLKNIYAALIMFAFVLTGCNLKIGYVSNSTSEKASASFYLLSDSKAKSIKLERGETIRFYYEVEEKKGTLSATFGNSSGKVTHSFEPNTNGEIKIVIEEDNTYELIITGDKARGSYKFEWVIE